MWVGEWDFFCIRDPRDSQLEFACRACVAREAGLSWLVHAGHENEMLRVGRIWAVFCRKVGTVVGEEQDGGFVWFGSPRRVSLWVR